MKTEWQAERLRQLGVRLGQGYRYGRPVALAPITEAKLVSQLVS